MASVIIPHYRSEQNLGKCVQALLQQDITENQFEIIVVQNEKSPLKLAPEISKHLKIIYEPRPGSYRARNKGVQNAKGEYIFFTDSDCMPSTSWISKGIKHMLKGHEIIGGHIELCFLDPEHPRAIELYEKVFYFNQKVSLDQEYYAATANLIVKKELFNSVGPFDASLMSGGDREWGRRAYNKGYDIHFAEDAIVFHPTRTKFFESLRRRIRIASNDLYIRMRKFGLSPEGNKELKKQLLSPPNPESWSANWKFFESLSKNQKNKVLKYHKIFSRVDYLIVVIGSVSFRALKAMTQIDRLRLK